MSGFLPDLAAWALRGGAGNNNDDNNTNNNGNNNSNNDSGEPPLTEQEIRARRLARMEAQSRATLLGMTPPSPSTTNDDMQVEQGGTAATATSGVAMAVSSSSSTTPSSGSAMENSSSSSRKSSRNLVFRNPTEPTSSAALQNSQKKKAKEMHSSTTATTSAATASSSSFSVNDPVKKLQRKKEVLLKKILYITLSNGINADAVPNTDPACIRMELDNPIPLEVHSITELLANRLTIPMESLSQTTPPQKPLIPYLATAHKTATEELRTLQSISSSSFSNPSSSKARAVGDQELVALLMEIQRQVVSYAASSLMEPDLFVQGQDGVEQLTKALMSSGLDPTQDITFGVFGPTSSFYHHLCEELHSQDESSFTRILGQVVKSLLQSLRNCESLDSGVGDTSALGIVTTLTSLCANKKSALIVSKLDCFLLPPESTPQATETVQPPPMISTSTGGGSGPGGNGVDFLRFFSAEHRPYRRRSGPGIEKETLLGLVLRISTPKSNHAFDSTSILRQTLDSVERATSQQRQQLHMYQESCHQLIMNLIKGGTEAREQVLSWFVDCQLVNVGATAMRPDTTKVSSSGLLLNVSVELLKLCDPFMGNESKHKLIDAGFVSWSDVGARLFPTTGDSAISRLGESSSSTTTNDADGDSPMETTEYAPKNTFVPQVFFMTARSLALGIVPLLSSHENLLRHISHHHWELNSQNRDVYTDPHLAMLLSRQRSSEVTLFQEEMTTDTVRFMNLMSKILLGLSDDVLKKMPEHFVDNVCDVLMSLAKLKPRSLRGMDVRFVFSLMVKLLSPKYKSMVRNYNLRAMLGDVLYEIFLPAAPGDRRDVPESLCTDPLAGGRTYLLSDTLAQKTLAPSLLLLYGEVEHTGYYDKMSHRAKISSLLKYLWESSEHRPAFREITQNKESFIKFANGIINETNHLISTVMQKLPEIRSTQELMKNVVEWGRLSEEEQGMMSSRLGDNEREVKHALPLCNKTLQMFGYLNTDPEIRALFLLDEMCPRLVNMLVHVLGKLVGSKGLDLKVDNPEQYEFRPKEMLRDLCAIFAVFATSSGFQVECAKSGCSPVMLRSAVKTCQRLNLLMGGAMTAFESLPDLVEVASRAVADDEALMEDAPDEFLDEILTTFMKDPVILPSGHFVDRSTITQHLLNDPMDPFNREPMTLDDIKPATELKAKIDQWLEEKRAAR